MRLTEFLIKYKTNFMPKILSFFASEIRVYKRQRICIEGEKPMRNQAETGGKIYFYFFLLVSHYGY